MARNKLHPIPHPPRTPVLGNMLTVDGDAPIQDLMRIAREQGPIFWLDMMGTPLVVVSEGFTLTGMDEAYSDKGLDAFNRPRLGGISEIAVIKLTNADVVRHDLVQTVVKAYEAFERNRIGRNAVHDA